jgi:hypothetical protein
MPKIRKQKDLHKHLKDELLKLVIINQLPLILITIRTHLIY